MSCTWMDYINKMLIGTGRVQEALIADHDTAVWAHSPGLEPRPEELLQVKEALKDGGQSLAEDGIYVAGTRYMYLEGEPEVFYHCKRGHVGLYVRQTPRVLVMVLYEDPVRGDQCAKCVINMCDYLVAKGF